MEGVYSFWLAIHHLAEIPWLWELAVTADEEPGKKILIGNKKHIIALLLIFLWIVAFFILSAWIQKFPVNEPMNLAENGVVNKEIYIPLSEVYYLDLVLENMTYEWYQDNFKDRIKRYSNGRKVYSGKKIPWRWSLMLKESQRIVVAGEGDTFQSADWSYGDVYLLISPVKVDPGLYIFSTEILGSVLDIDSLESHIVMRMDPKAITTWQMSLVWVGMIINIYVLIPISCLIVVSLVWNILRCRRAR